MAYLIVPLSSFQEPRLYSFDASVSSPQSQNALILAIQSSTSSNMTVDDTVTDPSLKMTLEISKQTCDHAIALLDLASSHPPTSPVSSDFQLQISKQQKLLITYLAQLRGLHRDAHVGARQTKAQTAEARQEIDRLHLALQNLYYEERHLQGEIVACESYE